MTRARTASKGLAALLLMVAITVGVPWLLLAIGVGPVPPLLRSVHDLGDALTSPDDGTLLLALVHVAAWLSWAVLTALILAEVVARIRGRNAPTLPGLGGAQTLIKGLVGAAIALFLAGQPALASSHVPQPSLVSAGQPVRAESDLLVDRQSAHSTPTNTSAGSHRRNLAPVAATQSTPLDRTEPATGEHVDGPGDQDYLVHLVVPGDSLWRLADRYLGDGARFDEIVQLNRGRVQHDGRTLEDSQWLLPGWQLRVPVQNAEPGIRRAAAEVSTDHVVDPGETLWQIADDRLGDGELWPQIQQSSRDVEQPDGQRLTDPDLIRPGWTLRLPGAPSPVATEPDTSRTPAELGVPRERPERDPSAHPDAVPDLVDDASSDSDSTDVESVTASSDDLDLEEPSPWHVRTTTGVGGLLAAGLLSLVEIRRRSAALRRRPGQRLSANTPDDAATTEQHLREVADPVGVRIVDLALRHLARDAAAEQRSLPQLRVVRLLNDQLEIYLEHPATLPSPWRCPPDTPEGLVWVVNPDEVPDLGPEELAAIPAPYPALVTFGHDEEGAHLLADLERLHLVDLDGPADLTRAALAAIAVELATSHWADDIQITVVGDFAILEDALETGRLRYLPALDDVLDELIARSATDSSALQTHGLNLSSARVSHQVPDAWTPQILIVAGPITDAQKQRLLALADRVPPSAWAAVTVQAGIGRWLLRIHDPEQAELEPVGIRLRPQLLPDTVRSDVQGLVANYNPDNAPDDDQYRDLTLADLADSADRADTDATAPHTVQENPAGQEMTTVSSPLTHGRSNGDEFIDPDELLDVARAPVVRVLGPVRIDGARGPVEPSKRARLTELIAFLSLNSNVDGRQIDEAIWPGRRHEDNLNTRNTATSKARAWLGRDANGTEFLPRHAAGTGYVLSDDVRSDWDLWRKLVGESTAIASTEDLSTALSLVRGRPFDGVHPRRYAWADALRQQMSTQIVDVAHELAKRRLLAGRWQSAELATAIGLSIEPAWEPLWRLRIMAAHEARNQPAVREAVARMLAVTDTLGGDLEDATVQLLSELKMVEPVTPMSGSLRSSSA